MGLDKPLATQFGDYFWSLARGDLGRSAFSGRPAVNDLLDRLPSTLELITLGIIFAFVIGVGVAVLSADHDRGVRNVTARTYGTIGTAVPDFFLALVLILVFYTTLKIAPSPIGQAGTHAPEIPNWSGAYFIDAIRAGNASAVGEGLAHLVLPVATLAIVYLGFPIYRVARAAIEESRRAPYVDYAVIMGASPALRLAERGRERASARVDDHRRHLRIASRRRRARRDRLRLGRHRAVRGNGDHPERLLRHAGLRPLRGHLLGRRLPHRRPLHAALDPRVRRSL